MPASTIPADPSFMMPLKGGVVVIGKVQIFRYS